MRYSLNSLKGGYIGEYIGVVKGATRSLDYGSYRVHICVYVELYRVAQGYCGIIVGTDIRGVKMMGIHMENRMETGVALGAI